ncbi:hypothetical protein K8T06_03415 [bacterium]|nr:hypothetical protein [bacterium]
MIGKQMVVTLVMLLITIGFCVIPVQGVLLKYRTDNDLIAKNSPPGLPGQAWDVGGGLDLTLPPGASTYFAFKNVLNLSNHKILTVLISGAIGGDPNNTIEILGAGTQGFKTGDDTQTVPRSWNIQPLPPNTMSITFNFGRQPLWERIQFRNISGNPVNYSITANCKCWNGQRWVYKCNLDNAAFGADGAMDGDQRIKEVYYFPSTVPIDTSVPPLFMGPPGSGNWTYQFVFNDPDGNPRPLGGVEWTSDGAGLGPSEEYDTEFTMTEEADASYDVYAYDDEHSEYQLFHLNFNQIYIPTLSGWGMMILMVLMLFVLAFSIRS